MRILGTGSNQTIHKENHCKFLLDPFRILFSPGNLKERQFLPTIIKPNETIIDMFACVGQFTIPIAVHAQPQQVYAIEKNPVAFRYLKHNILMNHISHKVTVIKGDSKEKTPSSIADRVIMGLIPPDPLNYLPEALSAIKKEGIIHFHGSYPVKNLNTTVMNRLTPFLESTSTQITIQNIRVIKKYAPNILHVVVDLQIKKI